MRIVTIVKKFWASLSKDRNDCSSSNKSLLGIDHDICNAGISRKIITISSLPGFYNMHNDKEVGVFARTIWRDCSCEFCGVAPSYAEALRVSSVREKADSRQPVCQGAGLNREAQSKTSQRSLGGFPYPNEAPADAHPQRSSLQFHYSPTRTIPRW